MAFTVSTCQGDAYPRTDSWKDGNVDCCRWDGITCDPSSGHVTELDLSCNILTGRFPSNSTLFHLRHLRHLNLAENNFSAAPIPPDFGRLSNLEYLNLSRSEFNGQVPEEIGCLSQLTSLDFSYLFNVKMLNFKTIITNLTSLRDLDLSFVTISSDLPPRIANLSKLESLRLADCSLQGEFQETAILSMPNLRVLDLEDNNNMYRHFSALRWTSPLELVDFSENNFTGILPESIGDSSNFSMRFFNIDNCHFYGNAPSWIWNVSEVISASFTNSLTGSLPQTVNTTRLKRLSAIFFSSNKITGTLPAWLFTLPSLNYLNFQHNLLTGIEQFVNTNGSTNSSVLLDFSATGNQLQGQIPEAIFGLRNLALLELEKNKLTGSISLSKLLKLQNLNTLLLSDNNLFVVDDVGAESTSFFPRMTSLGLSSCSLGHFPNFLRKQKGLTELHLSNNGIHDVVPGWLIDLNSLQILDLSYNSLTGGLENLQRQSIKQINTKSSMFEGPVPSAIPSSLCHLSDLQLLDLSHNNLTGYIPECFTYFISPNLEILDLKQNKLQGIIPSIIFENCSWAMAISLSGNLLQGPIPHSLGNCKLLNLLDVGDNKLNGTFPHWLNVLPNLQVLVLGTNNLHGPLPSFNMANSFLKLQILDFSNNEFTGALPPGFLISFKAMMANNPPQDQLYMFENFSYRDSIKAWVKGFYRELHEILDSLFLIDASRNRLEGHIPEAIGNLVALRWLNLADNNFTGIIPPSLGNLRFLESLDLSINRLDGHIPSELVNLNFLGFFNVSENNLVGPVPTGKQFNTFLDNSYIGNPRLCGELLRKKCRINDEPPTLTPAEENDSGSSSFHLWETVLMGFGSGLFVGLVWGYFMFWEREYYWVVKLTFKIEVFILLCLGLQSRRN